jgi:uncharacterized OsmC-like protein
MPAIEKKDERRPEKKERTIMTTTTTAAKIVNGVSVDDLTATIGAITAVPPLAVFKFRVHNQWVDGAQNRSSIDSFYGAGQEQTRSQQFVLEADEPLVLLGKDTAVNAGEYLLHALAACLTGTMVFHAAARGIEIDEIESSLEGDVDLRGFLGIDKSVRNGFQGIRVNFKIKADATDEQLQEIGVLAPSYSPIFDTLTNGVPVTVTAERM